MIFLHIMVDIEWIRQQNLKPRDLLPSIFPWIKERECILVVGSRQSGKTSLLYLVIQHLFQHKKLFDENLAFLDLEDPADLELAQLSPDDLLTALKLKGKRWSQARPLYLVFDEIHLLENPARLIKLLVDHHPRVSLLATGSSSTGIRQKFSDALPGRKQEFFLHTLGFGEYLDFVGKNELKRCLFSADDLYDESTDLPSPQVTKILLRDIERHNRDYMVFGGYPAVALTPHQMMKQRRLGAIFNDYVRKDLGTLFSVEHLSEFTRLVKLLAARTGGLLTYAHLASALSLNQRTVSRYLDILEATFILTRVTPYRTNIGKRLVKAPKIYFYDNGLRNTALGDFSGFENRSDQGALVENTIFRHLVSRLELTETEEISFWRTPAGAEVDFMWRDILIEVKSGPFTGPPPRGLMSCMAHCGIKKALIFNRNRMERLKIDDREIMFFPYSLLR
ncbi:MAG: ATP-binding protein [Deltaproteobacteria bacterium]|nr:ATP-binding protein [Deltaproteobacteria bacterium]